MAGRNLLEDNSSPTGRNLLTDIPKENQNPIKKEPIAFTGKDTPLGDMATQQSIPGEAKAQAAYTGLLSFGATIANLFTKPTKLGSAKAQQVYDTLHPTNQIKQQLDPMLQSHVTNQNAQFQANLGQYGNSLQVPYMTGQAIGSMPLNPAMGALSKLPGMAASVLPTGLQTIGKLAAGAGAGALSGGLFGATSYDPNNTGPLNLQAAKEYATNPLSAGLGLAGSLAGGYAAQTNKLMQQEDKGFGAIALNRDLKPKVKTLADNVFGSLPIIGDKGRRFAQQQSFIPGVQKFIKGLSADVADKLSSQSGTASLDSAVTSAINSANTRITATENSLWKPINDLQSKIKLEGESVQAIKAQVRGFLNNHGDEISTTNKGLFSYLHNNVLDNKNPHPSFENLKQMKSAIQKYITGNPLMSKPAQEDAHTLVSGLYNNLDDAIYKVDPNLIPDYHKATAFTAAKYKMFNEAGDQFKAAIKDNASAYSFAQKLITEKSPLQVSQMMAPFTDQEANKIRAGLIGKHLKNSIDASTGAFNITKFLKDTSDEKNIKELMGPTYQALNGLQEVMKPVQQALNTAKMGGPTGNMKQGLAYGGLAAVGAGAYAAPVATAAVVGSAAALAKISQYSPLKRILIAATKATDNPRLLEKLSKEAQTKIQRYGLIIGGTPDGAVHLQSKEDLNNE